MSEVGGIAGDQLRSFIERAERLNEEAKALNADKSELFKEARSAGFDVKAMKAVIRRRATDSANLQEHDALIYLYERALGTPIAVHAGTNVVGFNG